MAYHRGPPTDPSRRLPWVALGVGLLVIAVAGAFYLLNRPRTVNITLEATPTANPVAQAQTVQAGPPPTFTPPPAAPPPTATALPTPTAVPVASPAAGFVPAGSGSPSPAPAAAPPSVAPVPPAAGQPAPTAQAPPAAGQPAPTGQAPPAASAPTATAALPPTPTQAPTPTPFAGQVANAGGLGNTRADVDAAYGAPTGETPDHLIAYRRGTTEFHVGFTPDPARSWVISELVPQGTQMTLDQAMAEARKLFPRDAQPRGGQPEGNDQFVVERFTSPTLGQAIPADQFAQRGGNPGDFLAVYARDPAQGGRITRVIVGIGNDPSVLLNTR